jgi:uncharacterized protein YbjT (DUF2867 family)
MKDVLVVGSTGLIGGLFLEMIKNNAAYPGVIALTRREIASVRDAANIAQRIVDFDRLETYRHELAATATFCALGTTMKKAGSKEKFRHVDLELPLRIAKIALDNHCRKFILISAIGSDPHSRIFYNQVKGELESEIRKLPFDSIHILRPSFLLGKRDEFRIGEVVGSVFMKPLSPLIPAKYRPVQARTVARRAIDLLGPDLPGVHVYEGAALKG